MIDLGLLDRMYLLYDTYIEQGSFDKAEQIKKHIEEFQEELKDLTRGSK